MPEPPKINFGTKVDNNNTYDALNSALLESFNDIDEALLQQNQFSNLSFRESLAEVEESYSSLLRRINSTQQLEKQYNYLNLSIESLKHYRPLLKEVSLNNAKTNDATSALEMELLGNNFIYSISGVIDAEKLRHLNLVLYRISRGNTIMTQSIDQGKGKGYFTIWFQSQVLDIKIRKIATSYGAEVFDFPTDEKALQNKEDELVREKSELERVLQQSYDDNKVFLNELQKKFWNWKLFFKQESLIFTNMDYADFKSIEDRAIYCGWVPKRKLNQLEPLMIDASNEAGSAIRIDLQYSETKEVPPTWIETNKFTESFQTLNDAYGYADHDEVNGGAFYCMYPFLFGIMFGDLGHSFIYLLAGIALICLYPKLKNTKEEMFGQLLGFRYFIVIMAICGMYCGLIYNEVFGLPMNLFGSHYKEVKSNTTSSSVWVKSDPGVYAFGLDPVWVFKDNELIFVNSMKMKISVVLGISQMLFGMILQLIKQIYRKDWFNLVLSWLPQFIYLGSFFGYMVVLIIKKWLTPVEKQPEDGVNLIQVLISMLLSPTSLTKDLKLYSGQLTVQNVVALIFVASIPTMLFIKPIFEIILHGKGNGVVEVFVINLIDVIEFTLSALSHTASYLRLWALSLAHSQLSHVLYEELFLMTVNMKKYTPIFFFIGFAGWAVFSLVILLGMECFSSLLHAIRLMWVEFSSKFYSGTGYEYMPLSFRRECQKIGVNE